MSEMRGTYCIVVEVEVVGDHRPEGSFMGSTMKIYCEVL